MKKVTLIAMIFGLFASVNAQKYTPYEAWMDSLTNESTIKGIQFYISDQIILTKNGKPKELGIKGKKTIFIDKRIIITKETQGVVMRTEMKSDSIFANSSDGRIFTGMSDTCRTLWISFDKNDTKMVVPFTTQSKGKVLSNNQFTTNAAVANGNPKNSFKNGQDYYEVDGQALLELNAKFVEQLLFQRGHPNNK